MNSQLMSSIAFSSEDLQLIGRIKIVKRFCYKIGELEKNGTMPSILATNLLCIQSDINNDEDYNNAALKSS